MRVKPIRQTEIAGSLEQAYASALEELAGTHAVSRLAERDPSLWGSQRDRDSVATNRL